LKSLEKTDRHNQENGRKNPAELEKKPKKTRKLKKKRRATPALSNGPRASLILGNTS
jgi:hypothetical protein